MNWKITGCIIALIVSIVLVDLLDKMYNQDIANDPVLNYFMILLYIIIISNGIWNLFLWHNDKSEKTQQNIKNLNDTINNQQKEIKSLKDELEEYKKQLHKKEYDFPKNCW